MSNRLGHEKRQNKHKSSPIPTELAFQATPKEAAEARATQAQQRRNSRDDPHHGNAEAVVETQHALGAPGSFAQAVPQTAEVALARSNIGGKAGTAVIGGGDKPRWRGWVRCRGQELLEKQ